MVHTYLPRNCVVFLLLRELTRSVIYGSQKFDSHKWPTVLVKENHAISRHICVDHCILLLQHLSNHNDFITNGYRNAFQGPTRPIQGNVFIERPLYDESVRPSAWLMPHTQCSWSSWRRVLTIEGQKGKCKEQNPRSKHHIVMLV